MPVSCEQVARFKGLGERPARAGAAVFKPQDVRDMTGVGADAFQFQALRTSDALGQTQRWRAGLNTCSVLSDIEIDQHPKLNPGKLSRAVQIVDITDVVNDDHGFRRFGHNADQARDFRLSHHLAGHEQSSYPCVQHNLGLGDCSDANTDGALLQLPSSDVHALVCFCMRT